MKSNLLMLVVGIATLAALVLPGYAQYDSLIDVTKHPDMAPPPSWQLESGTPPDEIVCNPNLQLLMRPDGSPACVRTESFPRLVERGWATVDNTHIEQGAIHQTPNNTNAGRPQNTSTTPISTNITNTNQFALKFYSHVSQDKEDNIFFSPMSISTAFAMSYEGALGDTARQIQNVFEFPENDQMRRTGFQNMMEISNTDSEYNLTIANALWLAKEFLPYEQYVSVVETYYDGDVRTVDFLNDNINATNAINDWVSNKTEEKIKKLFEPALRSDTSVVITNAMHFNALWKSQFESTHQDEFITSASKNKTVKVEMMTQEGHFNYYEDDLLQLIELPYLGDRISMLVLLPRSVDGIVSLENSLTTENLSQWKRGSYVKTNVKIPTFSLDVEYDLKTMQKMGISNAFNELADFSGIHDKRLYIDRAIHKAFVDVTERGTEAGAATGISLRNLSAPHTTFHANHPFVFIIQDTETDNILFIGRLASPDGVP